MGVTILINMDKEGRPQGHEEAPLLGRHDLDSNPADSTAPHCFPGDASGALEGSGLQGSAGYCPETVREEVALSAGTIKPESLWLMEPSHSLSFSPANTDIHTHTHACSCTCTCLAPVTVTPIPLDSSFMMSFSLQACS